VISREKNPYDVPLLVARSSIGGSVTLEESVRERKSEAKAFLGGLPRRGVVLTRRRGNRLPHVDRQGGPLVIAHLRVHDRFPDGDQLRDPADESTWIRYHTTAILVSYPGFLGFAFWYLHLTLGW
jgi:hypothetical protein